LPADKTVYRLSATAPFSYSTSDDAAGEGAISSGAACSLSWAFCRGSPSMPAGGKGAGGKR
jgi:hypothetical protein